MRVEMNLFCFRHHGTQQPLVLIGHHVRIKGCHPDVGANLQLCRRLYERPLASVSEPEITAMDGPLPGHYPAPQLHEGIFDSIPYPPPPTLASQQDIGLDPFQFDPRLENQPEIHHPHQRNAFDQNSFVERSRARQPRFHEIRSNVQPPSSQSNNQYGSHHGEGAMFQVLSRTRQQQNNEIGGGQFGILSPDPRLLPQHLSHDGQLGRPQHEFDLPPVSATDGGTTAGHFSDMKVVPNPPRLDEWRQKLFDVDDTIALTEDE